SKTTISACSSSLRMRAAAVAPPATPPTITTFISTLYLSFPGGDAADIFDVAVAHAPQGTGGLPAPGPAVTVHEEWRVLSANHRSDVSDGSQRHIFAAGDMSPAVLLRRADVQQHRAGCGLKFPDALRDVRGF